MRARGRRVGAADLVRLYGSGDPTSVVRHGYRIAFETGAIAYEHAHEMEGFGRRVRITAGNIGQLRHLGAMLWPPRPLVLWCFLSHKAGRLLVPAALCAMLIANAALLAEPLYAGLFGAQIMFYGLALLGAFGMLRPKILRLPYYFCMINSALFVWAYYKLLPSRGRLAWASRAKG